MNESQIDVLGDELYRAIEDRQVVEPLSSRHKDLSIEDAYRMSRRILERRLEDGDTLVGYKVGLTGKAVQDYFGISEPMFGYLTESMRYSDSDDIPTTDRLIHPRLEGEIAFVLGRSLRGPGVTVDDVLDATDYVVPAIEIVDSRIRDGKVAYVDAIADNGTSGLFVLGENRVDIRRVDLDQCEMSLTRGDDVVSSGSTAAVLGGPLASVAWLANSLAGSGEEIREGDVVLSGSLGPLANAVPESEFSASISGIGKVQARMI